MCGIIGIIGRRPAAPLILDALKRLEYRGYDSAGIATLVDDGIDRRRAPGKLSTLSAVLDHAPLAGRTGIGHTRWATHGAPTETNAHPHATPRVAVVHNGIIENHAALRAELEAQGQHFTTQTDTETIVQLVDLLLQRGLPPIEAAGAAFRRLEGAYALAMVFAGHAELMIAACHGAPLAIGFGDGEMFAGSDALALAPLTRRIAYLRDGDWAVVTADTATFHDATGAEVQRDIKLTALSGAAVGKGNYRHFMEKELHEHPAVIGDTLRQMINPATRAVALPPIPFDLATIPRITISACGSAFYAGLVGRYWFEQIARIPTDADFASEFRYRTPPMDPGGLALLVSQSGETADTMAALHYMRAQQQHVLSIVNVAESTMARASDAVLHTIAGPEIGVASTKAFTAQLCVLACLALATARARNSITPEQEARMTAALLEIPSRAAEILDHDAAIQRIAARIAEARDVLYLGRGSCFPIALEGALKLKEISYIHAEGYPAAEMKHGPIALVDEETPSLFLVPRGQVFDKVMSNMQEIKARRGPVIAIASPNDHDVASVADDVIPIPDVAEWLQPIVAAIPLQLLAYEMSVLRGCDVDKPRNLAKSVTVE